MGEERITVGEVSTGEDAGAPVELPTVDILTGRSFITGKSGSGKSNTASVIAEKLLDREFSLLIVDIDGEYYGLKEEYEILHVGADEECDLQVGVEHAEKIAELALQQGVPIILDVSSFLDERDARELLKEVAKHLFAKEKKLKQPFLLLVEEVHEFIPESAGMDECGRMLVKVGKRGRKHGLGMVGISQRPADVKKDYITQCDWLVWHRLTWSNDTKVAGRILGSDYADRVEDLDDGECFLMTDWDEDLRRAQMERKRTFDAGATPGLDDFERPELKSVSSDLVGELQQITEAQQARESRVQELERELKDKEQRIEELEAELAEAKDLSNMAEQFSRAMMEHATGRPFREDITGYQSELDEHADLEAAVQEALEEEQRRRERADDPVMTGGSPEEAAADGGDHGARAADARGADTVAPTDAGTDDDPEFDWETSDVSPLPEEMPPGVSPERRELVAAIRKRIGGLEEKQRGMLAYYREFGPASPVDAHISAGGTGDRTDAYRHNAALREADLIEHAGRGGYTPRVREEIHEAHDGELDPEEAEALVLAVEEALPPARPPVTVEDWPED